MHAIKYYAVIAVQAREPFIPMFQEILSLEAQHKNNYFMYSCSFC